jgi:hypothetical protein
MQIEKLLTFLILNNSEALVSTGKRLSGKKNVYTYTTTAIANAPKHTYVGFCRQPNPEQINKKILMQCKYQGWWSRSDQHRQGRENRSNVLVLVRNCGNCKRAELEA